MEEKVKNLMVEKFKVEKEKIGYTTHLFNELGADSLEMLSFVTSIEQEFNVKVSDMDIENLFSVENVVKFLERENVEVK